MMERKTFLCLAALLFFATALALGEVQNRDMKAIERAQSHALDVVSSIYEHGSKLRVIRCVQARDPIWRDKVFIVTVGRDALRYVVRLGSNGSELLGIVRLPSTSGKGSMSQSPRVTRDAGPEDDQAGHVPPRAEGKPEHKRVTRKDITDRVRNLRRLLGFPASKELRVVDLWEENRHRRPTIRWLVVVPASVEGVPCLVTGDTFQFDAYGKLVSLGRAHVPESAFWKGQKLIEMDEAVRLAKTCAERSGLQVNGERRGKLYLVPSYALYPRKGYSMGPFRICWVFRAVSKNSNAAGGRPVKKKGVWIAVDAISKRAIPIM